MEEIFKNKTTFVVLFTLLCVTLLAACTTSDNTNQQGGQSAISSEPSNQDAGPPQPEEGGDTGAEAIQGAWQNSPHADTFVLDAAGNNDACVRCHGPVDWIPPLEDIPESCFTCKFEIDPPPPLVPEDKWDDIPCFMCHQVDAKGNVAEGFIFLEFAVFDEYTEVETSTELCRKCHGQVGFRGHVGIQVEGAHADYTCTQCHNPHDTAASCGTAGCHEEVASNPGHDDDHQAVSCAACHDGSSLEVGYREEDGSFTTFITAQVEGVESFLPFESHHLVLESSCERCHYPANPWGLSENVGQP